VLALSLLDIRLILPLSHPHPLPSRGPFRPEQEATGHRECREEEAVAEGAGAGEDVAKWILKCLSETFEVQLIERHQLNSIGLEFRDYG